MAALCSGISYGLSQSCLSNDNKELIFVKLTDSAYRAIEEFQKNQVSTLTFLLFPILLFRIMNEWIILVVFFLRCLSV